MDGNCVNIYHRSIDPINILITEKGDLKFCGFSIAVFSLEKIGVFPINKPTKCTEFMHPTIREAKEKCQENLKLDLEECDSFSIAKTVEVATRMKINYKDLKNEALNESVKSVPLISYQEKAQLILQDMLKILKEISNSSSQDHLS